MEKEKKTWTEPKLTALVRRKPEEGILQACKGSGVSGPGGICGGCLGEGPDPAQCYELTLS